MFAKLQADFVLPEKIGAKFLIPQLVFVHLCRDRGRRKRTNWLAYFLGKNFRHIDGNDE